MYCKYCGEMIREDMKYCKSCGKELRDAEPEAKPEPPADGESKGIRVIHRVLYTLALVAVVAAFCTNYLFRLTLNVGYWHPWLVAWVIMTLSLGWVTVHAWIKGRRGSGAVAKLSGYALTMAVCYLASTLHHVASAVLWPAVIAMLLEGYHRMMKERKTVGSVRVGMSIFVAMGVYSAPNYLRMLGVQGYHVFSLYVNFFIVLLCLVVGIICTVRKRDAAFGWAMVTVLGMEALRIVMMFGWDFYNYATIGSSVLVGVTMVSAVVMGVVAKGTLAKRKYR